MIVLQIDLIFEKTKACIYFMFCIPIFLSRICETKKFYILRKSTGVRNLTVQNSRFKA